MLSLRAVAANGRLRHYGAAAALVLAGVGAAMVFRRLPSTNLSLLFLLVVLITAAGWGLGPSILASLLSFFALNFLFTPPYYTLAVAEDNDLATLFFFLAAAALTGKLASRMRAEAAGNRAALERVSTLLDFSRRMSAAQDADQVLDALTEKLFAVCAASVIALLPDNNETLRPRVEKRSRDQPSFDIAAAESVWRSGTKRAIRSADWTYVPLAVGVRPVGLIAIGSTELTHEQRQLLDALCEQATIAIERTRLVDELRQAQLESETERLRAALLSSVSHDLRTPLASIIGSATSILDYGGAISPDDVRELLETIRDESERLDRYIQNLLDMTRVGQQRLDLKKEWVDLNDLVASALKRLGGALTPFRVRIGIDPDAALIFVHRALVEQLLVNLLDNAAGFSPPGGVLSIIGRVEAARTVVEVLDEGPGIPEDDREKVFEPLYRTREGDRNRPGTGLGLAICQSVAAAHGGTITALPHAGGGTCMRLELPRQRPPTDDDPV
jgi:two-component system, OmpR family, sensor histidine kinase KdpD